MPDRYLIVGDGIAGATAAEKIRDEDEKAEIKIFTDEPEPLYNRIMLKTYMKGSLPKQYTRVHDENWYDKRGIDLYLNTEVTYIDSDNNRLETAEGDEYDYDKLLIATGGSPRELPQDQGYENLHYMWTMGDAEKIKNSAEDAEKAVVAGGGLLGIDLAVAYAENDCETYYLIRGDNWWHRGLDSEGADIIHRKLEEKGCKVVRNAEINDFESEEDEITKVTDNNSESYQADAVAVAIGQTPNSDLLDVEKNESGMIKADKSLNTSDPDIYASGNMVEYYSPVFEKRTVNGSWDHSEAMGKRAGINMLKDLNGEEPEPFNFVNTYGVGHFRSQFLAIGDWSGEAVSKNYEEEDHYRRLFFDGDRLVGAVMIGYTEGQEELKQLIKSNKEITDKSKLF